MVHRKNGQSLVHIAENLSGWRFHASEKINHAQELFGLVMHVGKMEHGANQGLLNQSDGSASIVEKICQTMTQRGPHGNGRAITLKQT